MERAITGYHPDDVGDWVAELDCGHNQHVRHRPPFHPRPWVLTPTGRAERIGGPLECTLCERAELPGDLRIVRSSPVWDEHTVPAGLRRGHRVGSGTWGRIRVQEGHLRFSLASQPILQIDLGQGDQQGIPPGIDHDVQPLGAVRFSIDFLTVDRPRPGGDPPPQQGGDPACWAALICPECGIVLDGSRHNSGCSYSPTAAPPRPVPNPREGR